eukprot:Trichotokara_eunicae@DN4281_c0_g1_i5.p1
MKEIDSVETVDGFWRIWNSIPQPSELYNSKKMVRSIGGQNQVVDALMIFRTGVKPMWEDDQNARGGHWEYKVRTLPHFAMVDEYWNNLVLGLIGGTIEPFDMLMGVRLVDKLGGRGGQCIRIEVWFGEGTKKGEKEKTVEKDDLKASVEKAMFTRTSNPNEKLPEIVGEYKPHGNKHK